MHPVELRFGEAGLREPLSPRRVSLLAAKAADEWIAAAANINELFQMLKALKCELSDEVISDIDWTSFPTWGELPHDMSDDGMWSWSVESETEIRTIEGEGINDLRLVSYQREWTATEEVYA